MKKLIESGEAKHTVIEVNKNQDNHKAYSRKYDDILKTASREYQSDYGTNTYPSSFYA